jgi:hypothetical protein
LAVQSAGGAGREELLASVDVAMRALNPALVDSTRTRRKRG